MSMGPDLDLGGQKFLTKIVKKFHVLKCLMFCFED
jgi:hypothetical protein